MKKTIAILTLLLIIAGGLIFHSDNKKTKQSVKPLQKTESFQTRWTPNFWSLSPKVRLMTRTISAEAKGEPYLGQVGVGAVIMNRVQDPKFPNTIAGVIYQPWAFTAVSYGHIWNHTPSKTTIRATLDAISGWDPTYGALYYYNPAKVTSFWIFSRPQIRTIGQHVFAY